MVTKHRFITLGKNQYCVCLMSIKLSSSINTLNFPPRRKKHKQKKGMNHDTAVSQSKI